MTLKMLSLRFFMEHYKYKFMLNKEGKTNRRAFMVTTKQLLSFGLILKLIHPNALSTHIQIFLNR